MNGREKQSTLNCPLHIANPSCANTRIIVHHLLILLHPFLPLAGRCARRCQNSTELGDILGRSVGVVQRRSGLPCSVAADAEPFRFGEAWLRVAGWCDGVVVYSRAVDELR